MPVRARVAGVAAFVAAAAVAGMLAHGAHLVAWLVVAAALAAAAVGSLQQTLP